ncbi:MAG: hypothetical protein A3D39_04895 [Candidatus Buchananbacteria bacterium RIFCSPHIGHO2_02_FULL_39_17]|uniref:DUF916 domain-containing protein n=1 Tax=Candidatus Buchananbacteria bacterium RIFCSPLOWO2_01_FULL_40_23b TaxID=1797544 RepID=A0A1G1YSE5_9BACT|nr:MAG: hypothetical protein A3D39_04895 [Candidatus Buchananbacteria bacterium RIFCSPHIGHO2_02_FULL_39_17]OGY55189.1 MAG: hypothetical protein A2912_03825 [Candidatus Buchananbacteria bacterium RIFCSPLOWO2_01_FULL_40_23b]
MLNLKTKFSFFIFFFIFFLFLPHFSLALTAMSPILEIEVKPGESQTGFLKLYNETAADLILTSNLESFKAGDETGQPVFLLPEQKDKFLDWFTELPTEILLRPQQVILVPFRIQVPANATPGGYYAAIFWQTNSGQTKDGSGAGISGRIATLVFLKVAGELNESAQLVGFETIPKNNYFFHFPLNFSVRVNNQGNIHLQPQGQIILSDWFSRKIALDINQEKRFILPGSIRRFDVVWESGANKNFWQNFLAELYLEFKNLPFGPYQAELSLNYGARHQTLTGSLNFWFIPWRLILAIVILIIFLVTFWRINRRVKELKNKLEKLVNEKNQGN